nr:MAG TPA: Uracil-DNA glycosylase [Caudoviricetes sp.]
MVACTFAMYYFLLSLKIRVMLLGQPPYLLPL